MHHGLWRIRLSEVAERDLASILRWTVETFGTGQATIYGETLATALATLEQGPDAPGSVSREEISPGMRSLHVARSGRRGRHFILYQLHGTDSVDVVRVLHDSMEMSRYPPPKSAQSG